MRGSRIMTMFSLVLAGEAIFGLPFAVARYVRERPGSPPSITMRSLQEIAELGPQGHFDLIIAPATLVTESMLGFRR